MQITVWSVTGKTEHGIDTTVHRHKLEAYQELKRCCSHTNEDNEVFDRHIADRTFNKLMDWLIAQCEPRGDYYSVDSHLIELERTEPVTDGDPLPNPVPATASRSVNSLLDRAYRQAAADEYADGERVDIDRDAAVRHGNDAGAHVAAWVWVDREDVPLCACGARNDDGEGFDGKCGSCADRAEALRASAE